MRRSQAVVRMGCAVAVLLFGCDSSREERIPWGHNLGALLPVPTDPVGNGPYALVVCQSDVTAGGDRDCNAGVNITNASQLNAALTPGRSPALWLSRSTRSRRSLRRSAR